MPYQLAALGGTFDHFHAGHAHFLDFAASFANTLVIGITRDGLVSEKEYIESLQSFDVRLQAVRQYCEDKNYTFQLVPLENSVGPTLGELPVDVLIVTQLTQEGGRVINALRQKKGLEKLPIKVCTMLKDAKKHIISSTRIRKGEIDRQGRLYWNLFDSDLQLTESQRLAFREPLSRIVFTPQQSKQVTVVVGDVVLDYFIKNNLMYTLGIYDLKTKRQAVEKSSLVHIDPTNQIRNPAGWIKHHSFAVLQSLLETPSSSSQHLKIDGEEDLLAVAAVMALPLGSLVYYGQPDLGMVEVVVSEGIKEHCLNVLQS